MSDRPQDPDRTIIVTGLQGARRCVDCITTATSVPATRVARILKRTADSPARRARRDLQRMLQDHDRLWPRVVAEERTPVLSQGLIECA